MRQQYTCIFRNLLSSRVWAQPPAVRAVWLWLQLAADPEGFVPTDMAGVALGANVSLADARTAMDVFEAPDLDAHPDDPNEGRIVSRIKGGWLIIDFEAARERAKLECEKARKRRYMARARAMAKATANDTSAHIKPSTVSDGGAAQPLVVANVELVDQPIPTPKPTPPTPKKELVPPTPPPGLRADETNPRALGTSLRDQGTNPRALGTNPRAVGVFDAPVVPSVLHRIPESWVPSDALRADARIAGVQRFDEHIARLRLGPIGGNRGVFPDQLEGYIRSLLGKMRTWDEIDRAKAPPGAKGVPAQSVANSVKNAPPWVLASHAEFAKMRGLKLGDLAKAFSESHHIPPGVLKPLEAAEAFTQYLLTHGAEAA